jgi:SAM-dependent methyltransferase
MIGQPPDATLDQQRVYYNRFWTDRAIAPDSQEVLRLAKILEGCSMVMDHLSPPDRMPRICDLGCGRGWLSAELARFGAVTGVDLSTEGVRLAAERWPHVSFVAADVLAWRVSEPFDLVVSSEVIEHIPDKARFVATVDAIVRPGGYAIITTPTQRAKRAYFARGFEPQMIEEWLSPGELWRLLSPRFVVLRHETFLFDFANSGIYRLANSTKLKNLFRMIGLQHFYNGIRQTAGLGLYQILIAQKRSAN